MDINAQENNKQLIINEFTKTIEMFDIPSSDARLFSILFIEDTPMTLDEMSVASGKSKTSVSTGIRTLLEQNLVERVWKKGVRKDLYTTDPNLYRKFMNVYIHKWINHTSTQLQSLQEIEQDIKVENTSDMSVTNTQHLLEKKLTDIITFQTLIKHTFATMKSETKYQ
ncbi:GbsR/MarR family transcriptional regulator [Paraliobacillus sediminis]|uniref:GbsR/MarR family transcriptional regulator n=1 Tax=Paraliobacillus sediminis TaxID=1885916 RepID=UPI000E3C8812|nr:transcriptional regulator [Paraliobacillus sediminis]